MGVQRSQRKIPELEIKADCVALRELKVVTRRRHLPARFMLPATSAISGTIHISLTLYRCTRRIVALWHAGSFGENFVRSDAALAVGADAVQDVRGHFLLLLPFGWSSRVCFENSAACVYTRQVHHAYFLHSRVLAVRNCGV